jgi:hypothetical protein
VNTARLRQTLGRFATGVTIVSTEHDGEIHGDHTLYLGLVEGNDSRAGEPLVFHDGAFV